MILLGFEGTRAEWRSLLVSYMRLWSAIGIEVSPLRYIFVYCLLIEMNFGYLARTTIIYTLFCGKSLIQDECNHTSKWKIWRAIQNSKKVPNFTERFGPSEKTEKLNYHQINPAEVYTPLAEMLSAGSVRCALCVVHTVLCCAVLCRSAVWYTLLCCAALCDTLCCVLIIVV